LGWFRYPPPSHTHLTISFTDSRFFCASSAPALMIIICAALVQPPFGLVTTIVLLEHDFLHPKHEKLAGCAVPAPTWGMNGSSRMWRQCHCSNARIRHALPLPFKYYSCCNKPKRHDFEALRSAVLLRTRTQRAPSASAGSYLRNSLMHPGWFHARAILWAASP